MSFLLSVLLLGINPIMAQVITNALIEKCAVKRGSGESVSDECVDTLVVSIIVDNLPEGESEHIVLRKAISSGHEEDLTDRVEIYLRRLPSVAQYNIQYISSIHANPTEKYILTSYFECDKIARDLGSQSGAFCCRCPISAVTGVGKEYNLRNVTQCRTNKLGAVLSYLHFEENDVYDIYEILEPILVHAVQIDIRIGDTSSLRNITIGTLNPKVFFNDITMSYQADFPAVLSPPLFQSRYLALAKNKTRIPRACILEKSAVSLDGRECNKIGAATEAFLSQPNRCSSPVGSCVHGQIASHTQRAERRKSDGMRSSFYLSDFGHFAGFTEAKSGFKYQLAPQMLVSMITLESKIHRIIQEKVGLLKRMEFTHANVIENGEIHCNGNIEISIGVKNCRNDSGLVHLFCDKNSTFRLLPVSLTLSAYEARSVQMHVAIAQTSVNNDTLTSICLLTASNAHGEVLARHPVVINLRDFPLYEATLQNKADAITKFSSRLSLKKMKSCLSCPVYFPACFVLRACLWRGLSVGLSSASLFLFFIHLIQVCVD